MVCDTGPLVAAALSNDADYQACVDPELLVVADQPFHGQQVPAEVLHALLRDARLAPFAGDPLKGRFRVVGYRRVLLCQLGQGARDLRVAVFNHHA